MLERDIQHDCVQWVRTEHPDCLVFSVPNEAARTRSQFFAYSGMSKGAPDLVVVLPEKVVFVEMKTKKGRVRPEQAEFGEACASLGVSYHICRSLEEFQAVVDTYI